MVRKGRVDSRGDNFLTRSHKDLILRSLQLDEVLTGRSDFTSRALEKTGGSWKGTTRRNKNSFEMFDNPRALTMLLSHRIILI